MLNKKFISVFFIISFFSLIFTNTIFSQSNIPTPLGSTEVWQALKNDLNGSGEWNQISFADDTTQTTAGIAAPSSSTDNAIAKYDGIAGALQDSGILINDSDNLTLPALTHLRLPQTNESATPTLAFGNGDTGIYERSDNVMVFSSNGDPVFIMSGTGSGVDGSGRPFLFNRMPTSTITSVIPNISDDNTGIGWRDDQLSLIAGAKEGIRITESGGETITTIKSNGIDTTAILTIENTGGDFQIFRDDASPEGVITGSIGDFTIDTTNGGLYLKISGSATNTGWEQIGGTPSFKSYSLSNPGNSGTFYIGGSYDFAAAHEVLTIGGTVTRTFGTAGQAHGSHAFCVASGVGGTDLVLTVTGVSITDAGVKNDSDSEIIVADADQAITDQYFETTKKWLGQITYTLTGSSGAFTINYGFVKYEDFGNRNFIVSKFEVTGEARANETGLNLELLHHESGAFVYHASAFVPNQTALVSLATDYGTNNDVASDKPFAYKRTNLSTAISGGGSEGLIIRITTVVNNSINDLTAHIGVTLN
jgi:hypothetical protein